MRPLQLVKSIPQRYWVKTLNFFPNPLRPDLLPILLIMFAFIAVIVKRETGLVSFQLTAITHLRPPGCGLPGFKFFLAFCVSLI
jgi:hypothetical protein